MATQSYEQLISGANKIKQNELPESNTATLVGEQLLQMVNKQQEEHQQRVKGTTEYNVSVQYPTSGTGGTNKYTLEGAIALVPQELRNVGLKLSFVNADGQVETWEYQDGAFANAGSWKQQSSGGNKILEWNTDTATTRKQVAANERKPGMQISYKNAEGEWVNEQYIGTVISDTEWAENENWEQNPNQKSFIELEEKVTVISSIEIYRTEKKQYQGTTSVTVPIIKGEAYSFISSDRLNFSINGEKVATTVPNIPSYFIATVDAIEIKFVKYGTIEFVSINKVILVANTSDHAYIKTKELEIDVKGNRLTFNRSLIEIGPTIRNGTLPKVPVPGSGTQGAFIEVREGDSFIINSLEYSEIHRPYCFLDDKFLAIEGAYATGKLENETVIAPVGAKYMVVNNSRNSLSIIPKNIGLISEIENIKINLDSNNQKLSDYQELLYNTIYAYNDTVNAQGSTNINVILIKGERYLLFSSDRISNFTLFYSNGNENLGVIQANTEIEIIPKENVGRIYFERYGIVNIRIFQIFDIQEQLAQMNSYISLKTKYPSFSILGDSYSTFKDYLSPNSNDSYYPAGNVDSVRKTWWGLLATEQKMLLMQNNSYSGTYVCNSEKASETLRKNSFINRMFNLAKASVIFVFGGTNDSWNNTDIGEYRYEDWDEESLKTFRPAFAFLLDYMTKNHFGSKIVVIKNPPVANGTGLTQEMADSIDEICQHYNVDTLAPNIEKASNWHPTATGMKSIYDTIVDYLSHN